MMLLLLKMFRDFVLIVLNSVNRMLHVLPRQYDPN